MDLADKMLILKGPVIITPEGETHLPAHDTAALAALGALQSLTAPLRAMAA
ncbi:MAG TPA: hypothetical protein VHY32_03525 [Caulobacteraceae bacterium]|jgi:hypothetical protein|nr:hypothetical protein [Caulobacteraceae bacterium]